MADVGDQPSNSDVDVDKSESKVVGGGKQRLEKQAEVEVVEEIDCARMTTRQAAGSETTTKADNGEDQSPNSDESDRTVVDTGLLFQLLSTDRIHSLWLPYVIGQTIIFLPCGFYLLSFFFFSSPNLTGRRLDVYHTSTRGVALVRI